MQSFMLSAPLNLISVYNVKDTDKYSGSLKRIFDLLHYVDDGSAMMDFVKKHEEEIIQSMFSKGMTCEDISNLTDIPLEQVQQVVV